VDAPGRLGGFQNFDAALATPQVVDHRLAYMTRSGRTLQIRDTLADQLGLEEAIAGSPGWSESGGPMGAGVQGMKKYVWSETFVEGGKPFTGTLAHPPSNTGAFQNIGIHDGGSSGLQADSAVLRRFGGRCLPPGGQRCVHRIAAPEDHGERRLAGFAMLSDGDLEKTTKLPIPAAGENFLDSI
jgi:hypothetical protein